MITNVRSSPRDAQISLVRIELSLNFLDGFSRSTKENPSGGSRDVPCGRAGRRAGRQAVMTKLIVVFPDCTKAPKIKGLPCTSIH
jgi:hypothetical protein